jgi:hypothetical protein
MNRRKLFGYLGAAVAVIALPTALLANRRRISVRYVDFGVGHNPYYTPHARYHYYETVVRFPDGGLYFYTIDVENRDDSFVRARLERLVRKEELQRGPAVDACEHLMEIQTPGVAVWV